LARLLSIAVGTSTFTAAGLSGLARPAWAADQTNAAAAIITDRVFMDIKIANYTEESIGTNRGARGSGRVVLGLYGKAAPLATSIFLRCVTGDGATWPNYINSQFLKIGDADGLLEMEKVRRLNKVSVAGGEAWEFEGSILNEFSKPLLESNTLLHDRKGLLTRNKLSSTPEFGVTTRPCEALDGFHEIFGEVVDGMAVLDAVIDIPRYTYNTATGYSGVSKQAGSESDFADSWFKSQRSFYVSAGRALGDGRAVDQRGKLLRRVTIEKAGLM